MKKLRRKARLFGLPYRLFEMLFPFIFLRGAVCMKHCFFGAQGVRCFPLAVPLTSFAFPRTKKISRFRSK